MVRFRFGRRGGRVGPAVVLSTIAALALAACDAAESNAPQQGAGHAPPPPQVTVAEVAPRNLPLSFEYAGRVAGSRSVEVRARVPGILLERTYMEGARVKAGDLLFRIDPDTYQATLAQAEASVAEARANLDKAERDWSRGSKLFKQNAVSASERDQLLSARDLARASLASAEAGLKTATINLDYTEVRAPIDGVTSIEQVSEGSLVGTGSTDSLLTTITRLDPVYINFSVPDDERMRQRRLIAANGGGDAARLDVAVTLEGVAEPLRGAVNFSDSTIDPATGTVRLRAVVDNPDEVLMPGQFVRIQLEGMTLENALAVPQMSVQQGPNGTFVYVVKDNGQAEARPVVLGPTVGDEWVVEQGLNAGDDVVVEGSVKVRPGAPVQVATDRKPAPAGAEGGA
ncbi:efflux RND transporter periplasmic adaptor subunit [Tistrella bauzanensis]|uniref:Efflux RND transporter periplasmic adaptor subunit n=1 Tax=Tistrella arctica TaxID=3133430 RepID=A0ABU9YN42_9PROT